MRKALILGGTGAMGVFLVDILAKRTDWEVYVTSRSPHPDNGNIHYILGNARDAGFMDSILDRYFDVTVDFMNYGYDEFLARAEKLVTSTGHHIFLSSSRVYAQSAFPLKETSPRLLETTRDTAFLATQRYALRKARQEDKLESLQPRNYTIVRPYITYSDDRLQLGIYEKEQWLYLLLHRKPLLIRKEILPKKTTLTHGWDVATGIFRVMQNWRPDGEKVHIVSEETKTWMEILRIYVEVLREEGISPEVYASSELSGIEELYEGGYNTLYDRLYDRSFCNEKAERLCGHISYTEMGTGLKQCLKNFLKKYQTSGDQVFPAKDALFLERVGEYLRRGGNLDRIY